LTEDLAGLPSFNAQVHTSNRHFLCSCRLCVLSAQMMPPEVAVVRLLRWANDRRAAIGLAMQHAEIAGQLLQQHNK
jgi:hypothetical protein